MQETASERERADVPSPQDLLKLDAYWRAANYLSVGQIYLLDNPLLQEPLKREHIKPRLLGHWGTTPGLNFVYAHLNRVIKAHDLNVIYVCGPGHGGPGMVANTYLEGTYSEIYPSVGKDAEGLRRLFRQFSFPGGIPSHAAPETPGSIHEGGELGYALAHAHGAAFDNPDLIVACVVGDGEAETGPLATSWHCNAFLNPVSDGAVLSILHLNGYKIANPTILGRMPDDEVVALFRAYGYEPILVAGSDPIPMHQRMAAALDKAIEDIHAIQHLARKAGGKDDQARPPRWPLIILRSPKGWTGPKEVDGKKVEGFWRAHQVPLDKVRDNPEHLRLLEEWMRSYRPQELFDAQEGAHHARCFRLRRSRAFDVHGVGLKIRKMELALEQTAVGVRIGAHSPAPGRRCYEAFVHIIDSMFNQHAKWLKVSRTLPWRRPVASLNYLLTSHVWRQDHNGFSHQDPGFVDLVTNKKADIVRVYLPPDANCLLWVIDHCLRTYDRVNVIVAGKQPAPQWLTMEQAIKHCDVGIGIWDWACNDRDGSEPDVVMACAGDVPALETIAAVALLRKHLPELKLRVVNVVDLMTLQPKDEHPHGISDAEFDGLFTSDRPVIFAYHGYPYLIHRLTYKRKNHENMHVRGFNEEGTTTTPFDMVVLNRLDRFHLAMDVIERVPGLAAKAAHVTQRFRDKLTEHRNYVRQHGEDMPEIQNWGWPYKTTAARGGD
jgi:phosphoketolase